MRWGTIIAVIVLAIAILVSTAAIVGEMRYRDCINQRDAMFRARGSGAFFSSATLSYRGCSHSPF